mgnify:CR=1 FL=1|tara:strand:+ start:87 stop:518 length:432 start_codon:yes stop_codon:yes gene_type:complete
MVFDKKAYDKQYNKLDRIKNPKRYTIKRWKELGLISNEYDLIYSRWKNSTNCEKCGHDYSYYRKDMDHCHKTGEFRAILCHSCNSNDNSKNSSGYPNISYDKTGKRWRYVKTIRKIVHIKSFKTKYEAIIFKWLHEAGYTIEF